MNVLFLPTKASKKITVKKPLATETEAALKSPVQSQPLVLVVENHEDTRLMLRQILKIWDCRTVEAEFGEEAIGIATETRPDLILMNVGYPPFDGIEATRKIRKTSSLEKTPIILLSSHAAPSFCQTAMAAGGNDYLVKPFELSALESAVAKQLNYSIGDRFKQNVVNEKI